MDSFELNKIIGAVLGTLLFVMGVGFVAEAIYSPIEERGPGYSLPEPEGAAQANAGPAEPAAEAVPLGTLLASANAEQGQNAVRKCQSCHNFAQGESNKQGPLLYGVVGRPIASHEGFSYSEAMLARGSAGETWTYENLNAFLTAPGAFVNGTKMKFAGVKSPEERANILAYLATLSASPVPFPPPEAAPAAEAPAGEAAPAAEATQAVPTEADAVATPTTTQEETPVKGTPTTSGTGGTEAPATTEAPAATPAQ